MSLLYIHQKLMAEWRLQNQKLAKQLEAQGVRPPMVAKCEVLRKDIRIYSAGFTYEYLPLPTLNIRLLLAGGSIKNKRSLGAFRGMS